MQPAPSFLAGASLALLMLVPTLICAAPAHAETRFALPFAPPNAPMLFETKTERTIRGHLIRHRITRQIQFARVDDGYDVECRIIAQAVDGPDPVVKMVEISARALENQTFRFHVQRDGTALRSADFQADWQLVSEGISRLLTKEDATLSPIARAARAMMARQLLAMDEASQQAILINEVLPMLAWAGRLVSTGDAYEPAGNSRIDQVQQRDRALVITQSTLTREAAGTARTHAEISVSMETGLVEALQSRTVTDDSDSQRTVHTIMRRLDWPN